MTLATPNEEMLNFVMSFVAGSKRYKQPYEDKWREVEENFFVEPFQRSRPGVTSTPYGTRQRSYGIRDNIILKDPETFKVVMTYVSKIMKALFGDRRREYVSARPSGWEDAAVKAPEVTRLLRYVFNLEGHYRTFVETVLEMVLHGTAVIESPWKYTTRRIPVRTVTSQYGMEDSSISMEDVPIYDDICLRPLGTADFYPDPGAYRMQDMSGVAKKFRMTAAVARMMAEQGIYDKAKVEEAIKNSGTVRRDDAQAIRPDESRYVEPITAFGEMIGYEYWGTMPKGVKLRTLDDKFTEEGWGVGTILNGTDVRSDAWPLADYCFPFHPFIINPVQGRFYGVSPAEVIRFDQSFADALKMLVAVAVVRTTHPPIAYDLDSDLDPAALRAWKADTLIPIRGGPSAVGTLAYNANYQAAFAVQNQLTASMQGGSGALGAIQGENGPDRESATVGAARINAAMDRPELAGLILENECLPPLAKSILKRYQQFVVDTPDLQRRIGEKPESMWLGDIMGDYDVEFCGSRQSQTRQEKLQSLQAVVSLASAVPGFQMVMPNEQIAVWAVSELLELPEIAGDVGTPETIRSNVLSSAVTGGGANNGNGVATAAEPPGMLPAQAAGAAG